MAAPIISRVELRFPNGEPITGWKRLTFREQYTDPVPRMTISLSPPRNRVSEFRERLKKGREFTFWVADNQQSRMVTVGTRWRVGPSGRSLEVSAAGSLWTATRAKADWRFHKRTIADVPLSDAILDLMGPFGYDSIVSDAAANIKAVSGRALPGGIPIIQVDTLKGKDVQIKPGERIYQKAAELTARLGFRLATDHDGQLLIDTPDYGQPPVYTVAQGGTVRDADAIEGDVEESDTNEGQYSEIVVEGKAPDRKKTKSASRPVNGIIIDGAPRSEAFTNTPLETSPRFRHHYEGEGRHASCPFYTQVQKSRDRDWCLAMAKTILGNQAPRAYTLRHACTGIVSRSGRRVWALNTQGRVVVPELDIDETMWLFGREFVVDDKGGEVARLTWLPSGALILGDASAG